MVTTAKRATKKKASKRQSTSGSRKTTKKKAAKKVTRRATKKKAAKKTAAKRAAPSTATGKPSGYEVQGVAVQTVDGRKPKNAATAFLAVNQIVVEKGFNPRTGGPGDLDALTASIKAEGLLQNLVVRPYGDGKRFKLIAGERRLSVLKKLGGKFTDRIPVLIRMDLEKDDDRARAVAVAESSPDGRLNLSPVEVGRVVEQLAEKGWKPLRIAKETGLHPKKVQRVLQVMETPKEVQERVHSGEWSQTAAIEFAKLPKAIQADVKDKLGRDTTANEIRKLRRNAEREAKKKDIEAGEVKKTKRGTPATAKAPTWLPARKKQLMIRNFAAELQAFEPAEFGNEEHSFFRGMLAMLLCDRGDIEDPVLPNVDVSNEEDPKRAEKINAYFDSIVASEAALHVSESDEDEDED